MDATSLYLPQLDHAIYMYWSSVSSVKVEYLYMPILLNDVETDSIFHLLLNTAYNYDYYNYMLKSVDIIDLPSHLQTRLYLRGAIDKYYVTTIEDATDATNLLDITPEELDMLNKLLEYRQTLDCTDLTSINYEDLTSKLSKLIYLYLDYFVSRNYSESITKALDLADVTDDRLFVSAFELYVKNEFHNHLKDQTTLIDNNLVVKYMYTIVARSGIDSVFITVPIVYPLLEEEGTFVYLNGDYIPPNLYYVTVDDVNYTATIEFVNRTLKADDTIVFKYFSTNLVYDCTVSSEVINQLRPTEIYLHRLTG